MGGFKHIQQLIALSPMVRKRIRVGMIFGCLGGVSTVIGLGACAFAMGVLFTASATSADLGLPVSFWGWLVVGVLGLSGGFLARNVADVVTHDASYHLEVVIRQQLAETLARLPLGQVHHLGAGRIKKIMHDDVKGLHAAVADASPFVGVGISQPIAALLLLLLVQWKLFLVVCLVLPVIMLCMYFMTRDFATQRERYSQANENINAAVIEFVQGMPVVRTFDGDRVAFRRFSDKVDAFTQAVAQWLAASRRSSKLNSFFIAPLPTLLLIGVSAVPMLQLHWISVVDLLLALMIGTLPVQAVMPLMFLANLLNDAKAGAYRICQILAIPPLSETEKPQIPDRFDITFDDVSFFYDDGNRKPALSQINLQIPQGSICALVGASGSGKSTLARLIPRFYDVSKGAIRIGGIDIRNIDSRTLLQQISFVFQEPFLVNGSVADNIRLAKPDASDSEIEQAARAANAHNFIINELSEGYQTQVGERGGQLSGGQRQRITIARALLSKAPIVILDEATAYIDPENEVEIQEGLANLTRNKTVVVIAHRLSTITGVDQIVVLDQGAVVECGRHQQLLTQKGRYASIWAHYQASANWGLNQTKEQGAK